MAATNSPQYPEWRAGVEIDHVNAARTHLQSMFPEATLNPNSVEMTLLESEAVILGPVALAYQRAPAAVVEHLMGLYGLRRHNGRKAVGKVKFQVSTGTAMESIPSGTHLRYYVDDYTGALDFFTTETITVITTDSIYGEAWIEAAGTGTVYNDVPVGAPIQTVDYHMNIQAVEISVRTRAGEDPETDASFDERARAMLSRQTRAIVYAEQFEDVALTREEVGRAFAVNNYDADTNATTIGHISVAVTDNTGLQLAQNVKDEILSTLQSQVMASITVHVIDPAYTTVGVAVTVEAAPGTNHADVQAAVVAELERRLDPMTWDWWGTITPLDIATWIDDVVGVARVITVPAADITLTGVAPLPLPGTMTVTVNEYTR